MMVFGKQLQAATTRKSLSGYLNVTTTECCMDLQLFEVSIVIVANDFNPTILNPDFLRAQSIVREEWGWKLVGYPITTPPFATASYDSGLTITVETSKFQIVGIWNDVNDVLEKAVRVTQKYVEVLPHVRYTGVGNNFRAIIEHDDSETFLKDRFLKPSFIKNRQAPFEAAGFKFVSSLKDARFSLSIDGGSIARKVDDQFSEVRGVLLSGNFHRDCTHYPAADEVAAHVVRAIQDKQDFLDLASRTIEDT